MENAAVIDIGTNSVRLLIAEVDRHQVVCKEHGLETTRLGEGVKENRGKLLREPMERSIAAVKKYYHLCRRREIQNIKILATSAVREAPNKNEFLEALYERLGVKVEVLSGEEEARYSYRGAINSLSGDYRGSVFLDVGGGSTEVVWEQDDELNWSSYGVGAVKLGENFIACDPPDQEDINRAVEHLQETFSGCFNIWNKVSVVGTGGTVTTLAAVKKGLKEYHPRFIHGERLTMEELEDMLVNLAKNPRVEREKMPGMDPRRADIIIPGTLIVLVLLRNTSSNEIVVSEGDILAGSVTRDQKIII